MCVCVCAHIARTNEVCCFHSSLCSRAFVDIFMCLCSSFVFSSSLFISFIWTPAALLPRRPCCFNSRSRLRVLKRFFFFCLLLNPGVWTTFPKSPDLQSAAESRHSCVLAQRPRWPLSVLREKVIFSPFFTYFPDAVNLPTAKLNI